jgi:predicted nucleic acid-binding protein
VSVLIDTCVVSELIKPKPDARVLAWFAALPEREIFVSVLTLGELSRGIARLAPGRKRNRLEVWRAAFETAHAARLLAITPAIARRWGMVSGELLRKGRPTAMADGLIAATALELGYPIATRNVADFEPFGVSLIDPWLAEDRDVSPDEEPRP